MMVPLIYDPLPQDPPDLIPGVLPWLGVAAIVGETNVGKSLVACEMASSVVTGDRLWETLRPTRTVDRVVYLLGEHTTVTLQRLYHKTGLPHTGEIRVVGPDRLRDARMLVRRGIVQIPAFQALVRWAAGAGLVIIDPLASFIHGSGAEIDNTGMRAAIDAFRDLALVTHGTVLLLSHMGKPLVTINGEIRRVAYAMRGASAQEDALTHVYYLRQVPGDQRFDLTVRKLKGDPKMAAYPLWRNPATLRHVLLDRHRTDGAAWVAFRQAFVSYRMKGLSRTMATACAGAEADIPDRTARRWAGLLSADTQTAGCAGNGQSED